MSDRKFNIICGHYGCGKSNYSINLALDMAKNGRRVMLVDLDLVNPYFLSSGYKDMLEENGIKVIAPLFANTNVETPALPADLNLMFETDMDVVMDLGGDDAGAVVLGRYAGQLSQIDYEMTYLVNKYRNLTATVEDTVEIIKEIEAASRCKATKVLNNSHLKLETTYKTIEDSIDYAKEVAEKLELPFIGTTIPKFLLEDEEIKNIVESSDETFIPVEIFVKAPWE
ncbi:CobQ/CobB/MinD/ParA nucleotide binding domain-containing protein [Lachnospiraceae bacterium G41]|nr:CobQ/CobB/MinD/ParA nucleotide binding domain-containing protein [Lachnospiraceae bacterium G41]